MLIRLLIAFLIATATAPLAAQSRTGRSPEPPRRQAVPAVPAAHFTLAFTRATAASHSVEVEMSFQAADSGSILLSIPAWTPGAYDLTHFARWITRFDARRDSLLLDWDKADPDTWRVASPGAGPITVSYTVIADSLDPATSWSTRDFLLLSGASAFLYPEGADLAAWPATVRIETEAGWRVATGMTPGDSAGTWREASYHDLVDRPFFVGRFDLDSLQVGTVWMRFATYPAGSVAGEARSLTWEALARMVPPIRNVFGEVPFRAYTVMQVTDSGFTGISGLEHSNSHVAVVTPLAIGNPILNGIYAHEIFHAWNGKRLRPADMVPYRYDTWQPTPLLWVSEGITDYYADLSLLRGGLISPDEFYALTTQKVAQVSATPAAALADASLSAWVSPQDGTAFIYYPKGSLAGLLLDIMIRDASDNRGSLDAVMREVYEETYQKGRGFSGDEWWATIRKAARGRDFASFRERWIDGREPLPYDSILPLAGLRIQSDTVRQARLGIAAVPDPRGVRVVEVEPGSMAAAAGVLPGDGLLSVGEVDVKDVGFGNDFRSLYSVRPGEEIEIVVRRDDEELKLDARVRLSAVVNMRVAEAPGASEKALRVREGILTGSVRR